MTSSRRSIQYTLIDAFTTQPFGGNPAAIIILNSDEDLSPETMQLIAREFNLPMTAFLKSSLPFSLSPSSSQRYNIRWFAPSREVFLCGHASLGAAHVLFSASLPSLVPEESLTTLQFETKASKTLLAQKHPDGKISLEFPAGQLGPLSADVEDAATPLLKEAFGVKTILSLKQGLGEGFNEWLVVELDPNEVELGKIQVKIDTLARIPSHPAISVTTKSTSLSSTDGVQEDYQCRVFAPRVGIPEDPVCGTANCLLGPYWASKTRSTQEEKVSLICRQVSQRGGILEIDWFKDRGKVFLKGHVVVVGKGQLFI